MVQVQLCRPGVFKRAHMSLGIRSVESHKHALARFPAEEPAETDFANPPKRRQRMRRSPPYLTYFYNTPFTLRICEPRVGIEPTFLLYESSVLPLNYIGLFFFIKTRPSFALLLKALFFRPFPLFRPAYVGLNESQFGQTSRKLSSTLFLQLPSI